MGDTMDTILLVDGDLLQRRAIATFLENRGYDVRIAADCQSPFQLLGQLPDLIVTDLHPAGGGEGMNLLSEVGRLLPETPVIVTTGFGRIANAVEAMKHGASDYVTTPVNMEELLLVIQRATEWSRLHREIRRLRKRDEEVGGRALHSATLADLERGAIQQCLLENRGNRQRTADRLGISTRTLLRKIREYDLKDPLRRAVPADFVVP